MRHTYLMQCRYHQSLCGAGPFQLCKLAPVWLLEITMTTQR